MTFDGTLFMVIVPRLPAAYDGMIFSTKFFARNTASILSGLYEYRWVDD